MLFFAFRGHVYERASQQNNIRFLIRFTNDMEMIPTDVALMIDAFRLKVDSFFINFNVLRKWG